MGRGMLIAVVGAAVVGTVGGGLMAVVMSPTSSSARRVASPAVTAQPVAQSAGSTAQQPASSTTESGTHTSSHAALPVVPADPNAIIVAQIRLMLARFMAWSRDHAGAPCPEPLLLGLGAIDPWGHPLVLTYTDQPTNQIMGTISPDPNGMTGTNDDMKS